MQSHSAAAWIRRSVSGSIALLLAPGIAACTATEDDEAVAAPTPSATTVESAPPSPSSEATGDGMACSQAGTLLDVQTPNDEGWQTPDYYLVSDEVDDSLVVDAGVVCIVQSTVDGDVLVEGLGNVSIGVLAPGAVVTGSVFVGAERLATMEPDVDFYGVESDADAQPPLVMGDVTCRECSAFALVAGTVEGSVAILDKPGSSLLVTDLTIGGDLTLTDSSGFGGDREGTTTEPPPVTGNTIGGSVTLTGNFGRPLRVEGNTISGDLACEGNIPAPEGGDNSVAGTVSGQCVGL